MLNHMFARELEARELLETRTAGWTDLRAALRPLTPEVAAGRCGIAPGTIRDLAERFVRARTSACYGRVGTNRGRHSTPNTLLIESLNVDRNGVVYGTRVSVRVCLVGRTLLRHKTKT